MYPIYFVASLHAEGVEPEVGRACISQNLMELEFKSTKVPNLKQGQNVTVNCPFVKSANIKLSGRVMNQSAKSVKISEMPQSEATALNQFFGSNCNIQIHLRDYTGTNKLPPNSPVQKSTCYFLTEDTLMFCSNINFHGDQKLAVRCKTHNRITGILVTVNTKILLASQENAYICSITSIPRLTEDDFKKAVAEIKNKATTEKK